MTTTENRPPAGPDQGGIFGRVSAKIREGRTTGWGVFHPGSWSMIMGGLMLIVSAFLPWVYVALTQEVIGESFVLRGTDGPGLMTLTVGFLALAGGFVPKRKLAIAHAGVAGVVVAGICLLQGWNIIAASVETQWGSFLPGMGLVLAGGGSVILLRATWTMLKRWQPTGTTAQSQVKKQNQMKARS